MEIDWHRAAYLSDRINAMLEGELAWDDEFCKSAMMEVPYLARNWPRFGEFILRSADVFAEVACSPEIFRVLSNEQRELLPPKTISAAIAAGAYDDGQLGSYYQLPTIIAGNATLAFEFVSRPQILFTYRAGYFPEELYRDDRFTDALLASNPYAAGFRFCDCPLFAKTKARAIQAIHSSSFVHLARVFDEPCPQDILSDPELWLMAAERGSLLHNLPLEALDHRPTVLEAAKHDGYSALLHCNPNFRSDEEILDAAIATHYHAAHFIPDDPLFDPAFERACALDPRAYSYGTGRRQSDVGLAEFVVEKQPDMVKKFPGKPPKRLLMIAAGINPSVLTAAQRHEASSSANGVLGDHSGMIAFMMGAFASTRRKRTTSAFKGIQLCEPLMRIIFEFSGWQARSFTIAMRASSKFALVEEARVAASAAKRGGNRTRN